MRKLDRNEEDTLRRRLAALEKRIEQSPTTTPDPSLYHQAGDVYVELAERDHALKAYGKALDGFLESGKAQVALIICNKILDRYKYVVRTHFTHACIALHQGRSQEATDALRKYVEYALVRGTAGMAIPRLRFLAGIILDPTVRQEIGSQLKLLGDPDGDRIVRGDPHQSTVDLTEEKRSRLLLDAARWGSDAVWSSFWLKW